MERVGPGLALDGADTQSFQLVAIDVAGNVSAPHLIELDFPPPLLIPDASCHHARGGSGWLMVLFALVRRPMIARRVTIS